MTLKPKRVSTDRFTYHPATKTFSAEESDFGPRFGYGRVYDDACDVGLTLVSHRTGAEVVFAIDHEYRDADGDLVYTELTPATGQHVPAPLADHKVVLFND